MPIIASQFKPAWWLRSAHAQTFWPSLFRRKPIPEITPQRVELLDGDFIDLAWAGPKQGRTVLLLHGLEGSAQSSYARGLMHELGRRGYRSCLMHFRGCSGEPNRLPASYHSGKTDDPQFILEFLQVEMGITLYAAVGFSLGGNVLLKWLGEQGSTSPLQKAAAMSVPFQLGQAAQRMEQGLSQVYQAHLVSNLRRSYQRKFAQLQSPLDVDVDRLTTFRQFDDQVTAPLHGFNGVDDYYSQASCRQFISRIRVPTLILHAVDDPFMYPTTAPDASELADNVWLETSPKGGHVGFISGMIPGFANYWGEQRLVGWLDQE